MAFKFKVGDRVRDLASGLVGAVKIAEPRAGRNGQLYAVDLSDGRIVWRGVDELVLDQAIAPAPDVPR